MAKILTMPAMPGTYHIQRSHKADPRYIEGQRLLVESIRYLVRTGAEENLAAIELLSDHFRTKFRMSDKPLVFSRDPKY